MHFTLGHPSREQARPFLALGVLLLASSALFFRLGGRTFHGDELGSLLEASQLGQNANSLLYFLLLSGWQELGQGEFWLRALSALIAITAVAATYSWARLAAGARLAWRTALLLATSAYFVSYGQEIRFYSLALLVSSLSLFAFTLYTRRPTWTTALGWAASAGLAVLSLLLNGLVVLGEGTAYFALTPRLRLRTKVVWVAIAVLAVTALLLAPVLRKPIFDALAVYTNADSRYVFSRGLSLAQVAKIPLTLFFFAFGEAVYPLTYWLVLPGGLVFGGSLAFGLWRARRVKLVLTLSLLAGAALLLLYLVFDPLAPATLQGAAPRYLIGWLPVFYLVLALGTLGRWTRWLLVPLLLSNFTSLMFYWYGSWSYVDDLIDWRGATRWIAGYVTADTLLVGDGRAQPMMSTYFPTNWKSRPIYAADQPVGQTRVITLSYDYHLAPRVQMSALMRRLTREYDLVAAWSRYPLVIDVYDRKTGVPPGFRLDQKTGAVTLPVELYGIEFQDVRLPIPIVIDGQVIHALGTFGLPSLSGEDARTVSLTEPVEARSLELVTTLIGTPGLAAGTPVASLTVTEANRTTSMLLLRTGFETNTWDGRCQPGTCTPAYTWRKRLALVGAERYPQSWSDFEAALFAAEMPLNRPVTITSLRLARLPSPGTLYVWALVLHP